MKGRVWVPSACGSPWRAGEGEGSQERFKAVGRRDEESIHFA